MENIDKIWAFIESQMRRFSEFSKYKEKYEKNRSDGT